MKTRALILSAVLAWGLVAHADDEEEKARKVQLLPKPEKGAKERIKVESSVVKTDKEGEKSYQGITAELVRTIRAIGDDGLSSKEKLRLEKGEFEFEPQPGQRVKTDIGDAKTFVIERAEKSRRAIVEKGGEDIPDGLAPELMGFFRRDLDGLARILTPKDAVKTGDTWKPDLEALLLLLGPKKAKLVEEGSKAEAKLEEFKTKKDGTVHAEISLKATIYFAPHEDQDAKNKLTITATVRGAIDGSAPPVHEEVTQKTKAEDGAKHTLKVELDRSKVDEDEDGK